MSAGLKQIDLDIAEVERCIVDKNDTIIAGLTKGRDTILEEGEVGVMNTALQGMRGARRKLAGKIRAPRRLSEKRARKALI